ncbi:MAG: hypothetical protein ACM34E_16670 [Acidobacteriota bacterium]
MADNTSYDQQLQRVMNQLAESVLECSDEEILSESEGTAIKEVEHTRGVLHDVTKLLDAVNRRLLGLGHTISPQRWQDHGERGYRNHCLTCGLPVRLMSLSGDIAGQAMDGPCQQTEHHPARRRMVSGRQSSWPRG